MKHFKSISFLLVAISLTVFANAAPAQSTDQSSPTPISSNELVIKGPKTNNQQYYYSFTGGPGEVTITLNVKAKAYSTFVGIKVFDAELNTLTYHNMSADTASAGLAMKKFDVGEKQTLVMSFTSDNNLAECKLKFGGAVEFSGEATPSASSSDPTLSETTPPVATDTSAASTEQPAQTEPSATGDESASKSEKNKSFGMSILDALGQRFNIPANGKLRIEMKDGSVQEIDLTQVKKILVKK